MELGLEIFLKIIDFFFDVLYTLDVSLLDFMDFLEVDINDRLEVGMNYRDKKIRKFCYLNCRLCVHLKCLVFRLEAPLAILLKQ